MDHNVFINIIKLLKSISIEKVAMIRTLNLHVSVNLHLNQRIFRMFMLAPLQLFNSNITNFAINPKIWFLLFTFLTNAISFSLKKIYIIS